MLTTETESKAPFTAQECGKKIATVNVLIEEAERLQRSLRFVSYTSLKRAWRLVPDPIPLRYTTTSYHTCRPSIDDEHFYERELLLIE